MRNAVDSRVDSYDPPGAERVDLGSIWFDAISTAQALERIVELSKRDTPSLVVTPNLCQVEQARRMAPLERAYKVADLSTPDGWPLVAVGKMIGVSGRQIGRVCGSDLLPELARTGLSIALVGGGEGSAQAAAENLRRMCSAEIVLVEAATRAELDGPDERRRLIDRVCASGADAVFVGLGVPKQESFALELMSSLDRGVVLCVGAAIDFAAGNRSRAPIWIQRIGGEWLYRVVQEPKRLGMRYARAVPVFIRVATGKVVSSTFQRRNT